MIIRMYDVVTETDRKVYGFVWRGTELNGDAWAVCYDSNGEFHLVKAKNLIPVE